MARPGAGLGVAPDGQPTAGAMETVGMRVVVGAGKFGEVPIPCEGATGGEEAEQPVSARRLAQRRRPNVGVFTARGWLKTARATIGPCRLTS